MKKAIPIALALVVFMSAAYAQEPCMGCQDKEEMGPGMMHEMRGEMGLGMLDLSAEQQANMKALRTETEKQIIPIKADIDLKQIDLREAMAADNPNRDRIMRLTKDINDLKLKIQQLRIDQRLKIHSMLTPEQKEQMKSMHHGEQKMQKKMIIKKEID